MNASRKKSNLRRGFTLIELVLYIALFSFLMLAMTLFLPLLFQVREKHQAILEVEEQGLHVAHILGRTVRSAEGILTPSEGESSDSFSVQLPNGPEATVTLLDGRLDIDEGAGEVLLTNSRVEVSDFAATNVSRTGAPGIVRIVFTLKHVNPSGRQEYEYEKTFQTSVALREQ